MAATKRPQPKDLTIMTMIDEPYSYQERILLEPIQSNSNWNIRLESHASWKVDTVVHPFNQRVSTLLEQFPNVVRVLLQTASAPSRSIPSSALDDVPTLQAHSSFPASHLGPSGVWIQVHVRASNDNDNNNDEVVSKLMLELVERRLMTAPLGLSTATKTMFDKYIQKLEVTRLGYTSPQTFQVYQLFLPTNGAGWSADALEQSLSSLFSGCSLMNNATALSTALLGISSSNTRRSVWSEFTSMFGTQTFSQGVQYALPLNQKASSQQAPSTYASWIVPGTRIAPCPLADSTEAFLVHWNGTAATLESLSSNTTTISTAAARPSSPTLRYQIAKTAKRSQGVAYTGRFETTITNHVDDCRAHVHFRDVLPGFVRPVWQSLQVQQGGDLIAGVPLSSTSSVEWNDEDDSAVLTVLAYLEPLASLQISLDYQPAFLSFQEFPGDPNRGFEMAPAVVTMTCSNMVPPSTTLYSNALLILPPVPDMSMPFNVTSLTCSLYAYVFGGIVAMLVKKSSDKIRHALHPEEKPKSRLVKLKEKIRNKLQRKEVSSPAEQTAPTAESHEKEE
jgi:hypothetical protein